MSQLLGTAPMNRKLWPTTGNPSTMLSVAHLTPWHAGSVEVLFSTKVQLYQIWIYFYSKVQHIPSASDYIKTYNVHTVDISTLPFTVSGLNRHYFSGFSFLQQKIKLKRPARKKITNVCIWWQRILWVKFPVIGKNPDLKLDGNIQWIDSKDGVSVFCCCHWTPHQYMAHWKLCCTLTILKQDRTI